MGGDFVAITPYYGASMNKSHENIELQQTSNKVLVSNPILLNEVDIGEEVLGRKQCLLQISSLCVSKVKALYLVGMGGIDKTIIAKAALNDVKHMYDASCFIECDEINNDCYKIACQILEQLKVETKPKDLNEAQEKLKSFVIKKKVIIVLDNLKNQSQIEDVVAMDDLFAMNGNTLIVTTRDWKVLEYCGNKFCKVNVEELDEKTSWRLFITHSCGSQDKLLDELVEVSKKIIKVCNGLPLSFKVIGAYLKEKKRLRYWERAFQRLKRERELDGDEKNSHYKLWNILRISFDNLRVEEKKIFLEICCFFSNDVYLQGMLKERALPIWFNIEEKRMEDVEYSLNRLVNQSSIKIDKDGIIKVHNVMM
ncbi:disease resistance protein RRS1 isoform X1 [Physcomitrium patens]|uniref:NB-ARC domain-containing protein n=2 Tax=Physcomitrium patens TaxID=3218 RepID=A0A7I4C5D4_PHYPA|nr:disease resistance protein RRS1-like [Physcomitrium patens]|eukprot:XP_024359019.1 disease resistance protein RRS1-like [Physcomitrella patens]